MKTILITGATSGIGLQTAKDLVKLGHNVILANRNMDKAKLVKEELLKINPNVSIDLFLLDLGSFSSVLAFIDKLKETYNSIDVLINNAGLFSDTKKYTSEGFELTMGVNYLATVLLTERLLPLLKHQERAKIIMISSAASYFGRLWLKKDFFKKHNSGFLGYSDSKLALMMYTKDLSERLSDSNIIVRAVHPGDIYTGIWKGETRLMKIASKRKKKGKRTVADGAKVGVTLASSNALDSKDSLFIRYDEVSMKMPRKTHNVVFREKFVAYTNNVIDKALGVIEEV